MIRSRFKNKKENQSIDDLIQAAKENDPNKEKDGSIFNSDILDEFNEESEEYSLEDILTHIKLNKYTLMHHSKIDNKLVFYKIFNQEIHFISIHKQAVYIQREYGLNEDIDIVNHFIPFKSIEKILLDSYNINFECEKEKTFSISAFHNYHYTQMNKKTEEERKILNEERQALELKLQMFSMKIMKLKNIGRVGSI